MTSRKIISFRNITNEFELLDRIRIRYQMYANDIHTLSGILKGYRLASGDFEQNIETFHIYLAELKGENRSAISWESIIANEAQSIEHEIPHFFTYLDKHRNIAHEELGEIELSLEQRNFDFQRRVVLLNVDYPKLPIKPPHVLKAIRNPEGRVHAFYFDKNTVKYYEQCFSEFSELKKWAETCFRIDPKQW